MTFEILFPICLLVLALLVIRGRHLGQAWRTLLRESAMVIGVTGFTGAQALLSGGWAVGIGALFVIPAMAISLSDTATVLLARLSTRPQLSSGNDASPAEELLMKLDAEDLRDRRAMMVRTVRRVAVAPGVVVAMSGAVSANAPVVLLGAGLAALGFLVAARVRKRAETEDLMLSPAVHDERDPTA